MTQTEIKFALNDIKATLAIYADAAPTNYTRKLWAEWDALIVQVVK